MDEKGAKLGAGLPGWDERPAKNGMGGAGFVAACEYRAHENIKRSSARRRAGVACSRARGGIRCPPGAVLPPQHGPDSGCCAVRHGHERAPFQRENHPCVSDLKPDGKDWTYAPTEDPPWLGGDGTVMPAQSFVRDECCERQPN